MRQWVNETIKQFIVPIFFFLGLGTWNLGLGTSFAQCPYNNALYTDLTPPSCPGSNSVSCMFGGEYVTVDVVFGNIYTFTTCGDPDFDTQLTLWTIGGGTLLSYNDDDCGLQSTITWTATFTGTVHVLLDSYNCVDQFSCMTLDVSCTGGGGGPVVASDCADAVNVCTNIDFQIDPNGYGSINEIPSLGSLGNPDNNNPGGSGNWGCLRAGELNSTWMIVNISGSGMLQFNFGGSSQAGFYDWIMYPWSPTACTDIPNNTVAPVRCNWNACSTGGTGLRNVPPPPPGGCNGNFEPPLSVTCGEKYIIVFSNYSSVTTSVPLVFSGTATVDCNPMTLTVNVNPSNPTICLGGSVTLSATGATTYTWSPSTGLSCTNCANPVASPAVTTTYSVIGQTGCNTGDTTVTVTVTPGITLTTGKVDLACNGVCTGTGTVFPSGGTSPFTYSWNTSPVQTTQTATGLCASTYTGTVSDNTGCVATANVTINQPPLLTVTASGTNVTCNGLCNGIAASSPAGGTPPYTYAWSPSGGNSQNASNLCPNTYTITVTDNKGCIASSSITITQPPPLTVTATSTNESCNGECDGTVTTSAPSGGTAPYNWSWSNGCMTQTCINLCPGSYTVTVTDAKNCTVNATTIINPGIVVTAGFIYNGNQCLTGNSFNFTNTGTMGVTYSWTFSNGTPSSSVLQNPAGITWSAPGTYTVTQTVISGGCNASSSLTITVYGMPTASIVGTNITCNGLCNGSANLTVGGLGTAPYSYLWSNASITQDVTGLCPGTYSVTVTDINGCTAAGSIVITQPDSLALITSGVNATCGNSDGEASVSVTGGTLSYTYSWNSVPVQTTSTATALPAGNYTVTVTDANGCTANKTIAINDAGAPTANITSSIDPSCSACDGNASVTVTGGVAPYTYSWNTTPAQTDTMATGLCSGTFTVTVNDNAGCVTTASVTLFTAGLGTLSIILNNNVSCTNACDGQATSVMSGGTSPFTYSWNTSPSQTTASATGLCPGTFTATVTDSNNCITVDSVTITQPAMLTSVINATDVSCNGVCNGAANLSVAGGVTPYTYLWSTGSPLEDLTNRCDGIYNVTITDANGCIITDMVTISEPDSIVLTTSTTIANCGQANGSASVAVTGGAGSYTYSWNSVPVKTTASATGLYAGCYIVTVTDSAGCNKTASACVGNAGGGTASVIQNNGVSCKGLCNAQATASITGGTSPFTYSWNTSPVQTTSTATGLCAGSHTITITDNANCVTSASIIIPEPDSLIAVITGSNDLLCNGVCLGNASVAASGGTVAYTYSWNTSPAQTTTMATGLCALSYNVIVTDANGCSGTAVVIINEPLPVNVTLSKTDARCNASCDGAAFTTVTGGTVPYSWSWNTIPVQTTANASVLCAGTFAVMVTDSNGCTGTNSVTINEPLALSVNISVVNAGCGQANGSATATASGGISPYNYLWVNNGNTDPADTGLSSAGSPYEVVVTDANGCSVSGFANISDIGGPSVIISDAMDVSCQGGSDGQASVIVTDGTPPYAFSWNDSLGQTNDTAFALPAGTYTVEVRDALNCVAALSVTIYQPPALIAAIISGTNVNCYGSCNGNATASAVGGTPPYNWLWDDPPDQTTQVAVNLCAGTYMVTATDFNGCLAVSSPFTITEPPPLLLTIAKTNCLCAGACNGTSTASVTGGTLPYIYQWNDPGSQNTATATGLCAGTYIITVTDNNGCMANATVIITAPVAVDATIFSSGNIDCNGDSNGYAQSQVSGGTSPYNFLWSDGQSSDVAVNLGAGNYCVTITDTNGCSDTACVSITQPAPLSLVITSDNVNCFGDCDGDATAIASGGTLPYAYLWNDPGFQTTQTATNLCSGPITVYVTDANNCIITGTDTITQPQLLALSGSTTSSTCGNPNGGACVSPIGGVPPYFTVWNNPGNTIGSCINNAFAGCYNPVVTDANGCTYTMPVCINDIIGPDIDSVITTKIFCNGGTSTATVNTVLGIGTLPFVYLWKYGADTIGLGFNDSISGLSGGTYTITVIDSNGCIESMVFIITEPMPVASAIISSQNASCFGACNGYATVGVGGGTPAYNYSWSPSGKTASTATGLCAGTHIVTITDDNGCTTASSVVITQPAPLDITPFVTDVSCFGGSDGQITLLPPGSVTGGTLPFSYSWIPNVGSFATVTNLTMGVYTVTVTDIKGCSEVENISVNQPSQLLATGTSFPSTCGNANGVATVAPSGGTTPYNYSWNTSPVQTNDTAFGLTAGPYNVLITDANGCSLTFPVSVTNIAGPMIDSISTTSVLCNGESNGTATASHSGGTLPFTYLWSNGQTTQTAISLNSGTVSVTVTDLNGCMATASAIIQEPLRLDVEIITDTTICYGDSAKIYASVAGGTMPYTFNWNYGLSDTATHFVYPLTNTTYSVSVFDANACMSFNIVTVYVTSPLSITAVDDTICYGDNAILYTNAAGGDGSYIYLWDDGPPNSTTPSITVSPSGTTTYNVIVNDGCGLVDTASVTVMVNPIPPAPMAGTDSIYCFGDSVANLTASGFNLQWYSDSTLTVPDTTGSIFAPSPVVGNNTYYVTQTVNGCESPPGTVLIIVNPLPLADFAPVPDETSIINPLITFYNASSSDVVSWIWDFGDGDTLIGTDTANANPVHTYGDTGTYFVTLTVENANGCVNTAVHFVDITSEYILFAPSAFSPNGDEKNDFFFPLGIGINNDEFEILIYDRWGDLIYEYFGSYDQWRGWDGRANGGKDIAQIDVYVWLIRLKDLNDEDHEHIGHVTLIR